MNRIAIFDLDDTLYKNEELNKLFAKAIYLSISDTLNIDIDKAKELFLEKREELKNKKGVFSGSTQILYTYFEISIENFEKYKLQVLNQSNFPQLNTKEINEELKKAIIFLSKRYIPVLLTNNHLSITLLILEKLNLLNVFDSIFTLNDIPVNLLSKIKKKDAELDEDDLKILSYIKPSKERIINILKKYNAKASESVSIGDRYHIDHIYSEELGMKIVLVENVMDVINFCYHL